MSCPKSGDEGRGTQSRSARMRPRFYPHGFSAAEGSAQDGEDLVPLDAESSDASEQQFAASLDAHGAPRRRFVPGPPSKRTQPPSSATEESGLLSHALSCDEPPAAGGSEQDFTESLPADEEGVQLAGEESQPASGCVEVSAELSCEVVVDSSASFSGISDDGRSADGSLAEGPQWRQEVAARLHNYHSRRTRKPPRYPSLALKFDPPAYSSPATYAPEPPRAAVSAAPTRSEAATAAAPAPEELEETYLLPGDATNIIEFPRPLLPPPPRPDELAEPILDLPRILDAPEAVPKQVPLGGIILHPEEAAAASDLDLPLQVAPLSRRLLAAGVDGLLVAAATLMFVLIVDKIAELLPSARVLLGLGVALPAILWAVYEYVFLVYTGSTPGMRLTRQHLSDFDGSIPDRSTRRWRALAMALSAVSLGLGFLWCLLDEDTLCWHDRITRTYLSAGSNPESGAGQGPMFPQRLFAWLHRADAFLRRRDEETSDQDTAR